MRSSEAQRKHLHNEQTVCAEAAETEERQSEAPCGGQTQNKTSHREVRDAHSETL
jgi:hypothetical protein